MIITTDLNVCMDYVKNIWESLKELCLGFAVQAQVGRLLRNNQLENRDDDIANKVETRPSALY